MLAKLLPAILDKLDIFVMELEELFIPKPDLWEWVWLGSLLATIPAFMASKKNPTWLKCGSSKSCLWRRVSCPSWSEQQLISLGHTLSSHLKSQPRFCNGGV